MKEQKFREVIDRIEDRRKLLGLNKSKFAGAIGMKPQTYNNFIGAQGSKPNIELILGAIVKHGMDPMYLLTGKTGENGSAPAPRIRHMPFAASQGVRLAQQELNRHLDLYVAKIEEVVGG